MGWMSECFFPEPSDGSADNDVSLVLDRFKPPWLAIRFSASAPLGDSVIAFVGCRFELKIECIGHEAFTQTANHMTVRGKVPARKHGLQFVDRPVKLPNQGAKFAVIDHRHLTPDITGDKTASERRVWHLVHGMVIN
ncbi:MAG: hypothetical protein LC677_03865 [Halomonas sp.]|nr:hypothetical protein [Halomonas sp.]